jgi:hypothetical protein
MHSLFDGRIQVKTPEEAARLQKARRIRAAENERKQAEAQRTKIADICKSAHPAINREMAVVQGLKK